MDSNLYQTMGASAQIRGEFLAPLAQIIPRLLSLRDCPTRSDQEWIEQGIWRTLTPSRSGRDFVQTYLDEPEDPNRYFQRLASGRRLKVVEECSRELRALVNEVVGDPLNEFEALRCFDFYAGDGHYLEHASHDLSVEGTNWATGHFFSLNLRTQALFPLVLADRVGRKKEHDQRMLKRQSVAMLRQGAKVGRKVLWVWDKAGVNLELWQERKASGIYFLSMQKENQCLDCVKVRPIDFSQMINQGVLSDELMKDRRGIEVRRVVFRNPSDEKRYVYLTSEMTLEPGLIALLYKTRWEIEKVFDETKTKLAEKKSWATSDIAKQMQSHFVAMTHNLLLLFERYLKTEKGIENTAELNRRQKREEAQEKDLAQKSESVPLIYRILSRFTQASFKLIRWLRAYWRNTTSPERAYDALHLLYAKL
jgi:hypothetical protein